MYTTKKLLRKSLKKIVISYKEEAPEWAAYNRQRHVLNIVFTFGVKLQCSVTAKTLFA